eukprot:1161710-Pelagomonas_calceolata.AAC.9
MRLECTDQTKADSMYSTEHSGDVPSCTIIQLTEGYSMLTYALSVYADNTYGRFRFDVNVGHLCLEFIKEIVSCVTAYHDGLVLKRKKGVGNTTHWCMLTACSAGCGCSLQLAAARKCWRSSFTFR